MFNANDFRFSTQMYFCRHDIIKQYSQQTHYDIVDACHLHFTTHNIKIKKVDLTP